MYLLPCPRCAGDGVISLAELREGLQRMDSQLTESELQQASAGLGGMSCRAYMRGGSGCCQPSSAWVFGRYSISGT
jgi:hypothetical protein